MPQTVSNGNVTVVNTGSAHTAFTGGDPCLLPPGAFDNAAPSANLVPGTSASMTLIGGNPTATEGTKWDPSKSAGKVGVKSGTTEKSAVVVAGSKDLDVEGKPAARVTDATTQNEGNSSGAVQPGALAPKAASQAERADKLCYLKSWTGVIDGTDGKVKLGWKGGNKTGDPNYIEVWDTAKITFTATREDITQAKVTNPKCERGTHTDWHASGKVFPFLLDDGKLEAKGTDFLRGEYLHREDGSRRVPWGGTATLVRGPRWGSCWAVRVSTSFARPSLSTSPQSSSFRRRRRRRIRRLSSSGRLRSPSGPITRSSCFPTAGGT